MTACRASGFLDPTPTPSLTATPSPTPLFVVDAEECSIPGIGRIVVNTLSNGERYQVSRQPGAQDAQDYVACVKGGFQLPGGLQASVQQYLNTDCFRGKNNCPAGPSCTCENTNRCTSGFVDYIMACRDADFLL